jgi:hypothetical protein
MWDLLNLLLKAHMFKKHTKLYSTRLGLIIMSLFYNVGAFGLYRQCLVIGFWAECLDPRKKKEQGDTEMWVKDSFIIRAHQILLRRSERRVGWAGNVTRVGQMSKTYKMLVGRPKVRGHVGGLSVLTLKGRYWVWEYRLNSSGTDWRRKMRFWGSN